MADANRLVSMIALVIAGLLIAAFGAIFIWLHRKDSLVVADLKQRGLITATDTNRFTNSTWIWILAVVQIVIGLALVAWGIFQYFANANDVVNVVHSKLADTFAPTRMTTAAPTAPVVVGAGRNGAGSRRLYQ